YVLTSQYLVGPYLEEVRQRAASRGIPWEWYQHQADCHPEFMHTTLQYLEERYGGIAAYVRAIGLSNEQCEGLRQALLAWVTPAAPLRGRARSGALTVKIVPATTSSVSLP